MSNSLQPHGLQHARPPCPSPSPGACSNSCPLNQCCPLLLLPSIFPSIRVFSDESVLYIKWPKYWSFSFSISPSNEYSGLFIFLCNGLSQFWEFRAVTGVPGTGKITTHHPSPDHSSSIALAPPSLYTQPLQTFQTYNGT